MAKSVTSRFIIPRLPSTIGNNGDDENRFSQIEANYPVGSLSMNENTIHIGTSGWHYQHWVGPFYPDGMQADDFLDYYARHFDTVEINNSFYGLPEEGTLRQWRQIVPDNFMFCAKASRYITHMKKLLDPREPVNTFLECMAILAHNLGPILFQLPPNWRANPGRLEAFLKILPQDRRYTFEFRDPSWFVDSVYELLEQYNAAFCIYQLAGRISPKTITTDFIYVRLHGPGEAYQGCYSIQELSSWAGAFSIWSGQEKEIFCYFDNDQAGYAVRNAAELGEMLA
jgi:uncharacterized protein YecE (DUF72 family)